MSLRSPTSSGLVGDGVVAAVQVVDQGRSCRFGIPLLVCIDDRLVLVHDLRQDARRALGSDSRDAHEPSQLAQQRVQDRELRAGDDAQVELLVEIEKLLVHSGTRGTSLSHQQQAKVVDVVDRHHLAGPCDSQPLERLAQEQELGAMLVGEAPHDHLPA